MRIFIFGAGYSAQAFARMAAERSGSIAGTTRSPEKFATLRSTGIEPFLFNGEHISTEITEALATTTHLVISVGPNEHGDPVMNAARQIILKDMPALRWIGYLSTIGVYGDHSGAWVGEDSECRPVSKRSVARLAAETAWQTLGNEAALPVALLRLAGIYGPGRNAFVNLQAGKAKRIVKPGQVFNRIHADDIAGSLWLLAQRKTGGIFNIADNEPAPPQDVVAFAAGLMSVEPPPETPFETAELTPMARSFYGENKRVSNARIKAEGYEFAYPDYRSALTAMWRDGSWR